MKDDLAESNVIENELQGSEWEHEMNHFKSELLEKEDSMKTLNTTTDNTLEYSNERKVENSLDITVESVADTPGEDLTKSFSSFESSDMVGLLPTTQFSDSKESHNNR